MNEHYEPPEREASKQIAELYKSVIDEIDNESDFSDDAGAMWLQDASEICKAHGIDRSDRIEVIMEGVRYGCEMQIEGLLKEMEFQLNWMFTLWLTN